MSDTVHFIDSADDDRRCYCCNCGWEGQASHTKPIQDLTERIDAGEFVPVGECPECGALTQLEQGDYSDRLHRRQRGNAPKLVETRQSAHEEATIDIQQAVAALIPEEKDDLLIELLTALCNGDIARCDELLNDFCVENK